MATGDNRCKQLECCTPSLKQVSSPQVAPRQYGRDSALQMPCRYTIAQLAARPRACGWRVCQSAAPGMLADPSVLVPDSITSAVPS